MKKIMALVLILVMIATMVIGCKKTPSDTNGGDSLVGEEQPNDGYKDTIIMAVTSDQDIMDGQENVTNDKILRAVYSSLVRRGMDSSIEGDIAKDWAVDETGTIWTFDLRDDVSFHNGKKLTSADVKASYDRMLDPENATRYASSMKHIIETEAPDEYTFVIKTETPYGPMLASLCARQNLILDADYIKEHGKDIGIKVETINGTGPYKMTKWAKDEEMVFEAHDEYFRGPAKTKNLIIQIVPEANSRAIAVETGQVDITDGLTPDDFTRLKSVEGIKVENRDSNGQHLFWFNHSHPIIKDVRVRQAISYAIDRELIVKALYSALGEKPSTNVVHPKTFGYNDLGVIQQDLEKARQLMKDAGYEEGFEFTIMTGSMYNRGVEMTEIIADQLKEINITAKLDVVESATFKELIGGVTPDKFPYGMFIMGAGPSSVDTEGLVRLYVTNPDGTNKNNYGWYSNSEVDRILPMGGVETDPEKRVEIYKQAQQILYIDDPVGVWMNDRNIVAAMSEKVEGFEVEVKGAIFWELLSVKE